MDKPCECCELISESFTCKIGECDCVHPALPSELNLDARKWPKSVLLRVGNNDAVPECFALNLYGKQVRFKPKHLVKKKGGVWWKCKPTRREPELTISIW